MHSSEDILVVSGLSKSFGALSALSDIDLRIKKGERRAVIGPNGAGKTTLFNCINGLLPPSSGTIQMNGKDITRVPTHKRARLGLARTFQITNLFTSLTVLENVLLAVQAVDPARSSLFYPRDHFRHLSDRAGKLLSDWELFDEAHTLVSELSYGQQRQLEIVLALSGSPAILLLDEPTAGLSAEERQRLTQMIGNLSRDISLMIIEHDIDVAFSVAEMVTVLHLGKVLALGTPHEMENKPEVQEIYLGSDYADPES